MADLQLVRKRLAKEEDRMKALQAQEAELRTAHEKLTGEANSLESEEKRTRAAVVDLDREVAVAEKRAGEAEKEWRVQKVAFEERLVALYKSHHRAASTGYLLEAASWNDFARRSRYLSAVTERDRRIVGVMLNERQRLNAERNDVKLRKAEREAKLNEIVALEEQLTRKRLEKAKLLEEAGRKKIDQEKSLEKLAAAAAQLERVLSSIMGSEEPSSVPEDTRVARGDREEKIERDETGESKSVAPFTGPGLSKLIGKLEPPVDGRLVQRFGKQRHEDFGDVLFVKGLEFSGKVGERVTPVAPGRVVLSQRLPGFGNVVIVDHGSRFYTLYGRLASTLVRSGENVNRGSAVGVLGEADHRGRNFYFELRHKGQAVDPREYFAPRSLS